MGRMKRGKGKMVGGYTYAAVREVRDRDRRWRKWKNLSQITSLLLVILAGTIAALVYVTGQMDWRWLTCYWCLTALKHAFDFMCGRLR